MATNLSEQLILNNIVVKHKKIVIARGLPTSKRTKWCKYRCSLNPLENVRISRDDLREMVCGGWEPSVEPFISQLEVEIADSALKNGCNVYIDAFNANKRDYERWNDLASTLSNKSVTITVEFEDFKTSLFFAKFNNVLRLFVGKKIYPMSVLEKMYKNYEKL